MWVLILLNSFLLKHVFRFASKYITPYQNLILTNLVACFSIFRTSENGFEIDLLFAKYEPCLNLSLIFNK